jgi:D-amino-acid oxidase
MADGFLSDTTSSGAGGLWEPYALINTPDELVQRCGRSSFDHFAGLADGPDAHEAGVARVMAYELFSNAADAQTLPAWASVVPHFAVVSPEHLIKATGRPAMNRFAAAWEYHTVIATQSCYMPYLTKQLTARGVKFVKRYLSSLSEVTPHFDVVVNCTGLGAAVLLDSPTETFPIRGQVLRVSPPTTEWQHDPQCFGWGSSYIIPNQGSLVLGGNQGAPTDTDTQPRRADSDTILANVVDLFPEFAAVTAPTVWVGLRPARTAGLRLDSQVDHTHPCLVVHNYGHGGSGITLAWGTAQDVVDKHVRPYLSLTTGGRMHMD